MITSFEASLNNLSVHKVGNKLQNEYLVLSDNALTIQDEMLNNLLMQYFLKPFEKVNEVYHFTHSSDDLALNEVYHFAKKCFADKAKFHETVNKLPVIYSTFQITLK